MGSIVVIGEQVRLRTIDTVTGEALTELAVRGIYDPSWQPFGVPWTDDAPDEMRRALPTFYASTSHSAVPERWELPMAVEHEGDLIGFAKIQASDISASGRFSTGSWLGLAFQGRGLGTQVRRACLAAGFKGLGAQSAHTQANANNAASLGVTRKLEYLASGHFELEIRGEPMTKLEFTMQREHWREEVWREDFTLLGFEPFRTFLGLSVEP
jgi:RimJ/RimL family protein N-acetyltransferase